MFNINPIRPIIRIGLLTLFCSAFCTGCLTYEQNRKRRAVQAQQDRLIVEERQRRVDNVIDDMNTEIDSLHQEIAEMRTDHAVQTKSEMADLQSKLMLLEGRMAAVEDARQRDKQEIIDRLSTRMAELIKKSTPPPPRRTTTPRPRTTSEYGYEHVVAQGETLSAIAAAYGVSTKAIMDNNGIKDPNLLRVGDKLFIPE